MHHPSSQTTLFARLRQMDTPFANCIVLVLLLISTCGILFIAFLSPHDWTLDVGTPGDDRFLSGFFLAETNGETTFRWSGPASHLVLHGSPSGALLLDLRLHGDEQATTDRSLVRLRRDDHTLAAFALHATAEWRIYRVLLPPGAASRTNGEAMPLSLLSETYRPGEDDGRDLGMPLDWIRVRTVGNEWAMSIAWVPLYRALLLTWTVAIAALLLWRIVPNLSRIVTSLRPTSYQGRNSSSLLLVAVVGLLSCLLVWWAYHSPATLAWALPPAPWSLGLVTLLLLIGVRGRRSEVGDRGLGGGGWGAGNRHYVTLALLVLVFLLALGLRLYRIEELPYSLWRDEARHGQVALRILEDTDYRPVYEPRWGIHLPGMGFYPFALALHLWGIHAWSMRLITAVAGALTVLPLYALVAGLFRRHDMALLAAALLAVSSWHISISRFSFPTIFGPLLTLTGLWLIVQGEQLRTTARRALPLALFAWLLAGMSLGMSVQTYHTGRVVPLLAVVLVVAMLYRRREPAHPHSTIQRLLIPLGCIGVGLLLVTTPLILYALEHTEAFQRRVGTLFILSDEARQGRAPLAMFDDALRRHLLMFHVRGDSNGRHHAPDQPMLDGITGIGLLVGCGLLLYRWRDWRSCFLLIALSISLLPSLLAVEGPHAMRSIEAAALACAIAALGWVELIHGVAASIGQRQTTSIRDTTTRKVNTLVRVMGIGVVGIALALNFHTYFVHMARDPAVWSSSYPVHTQMGIYLRYIADTQGSTALLHTAVPDHLRKNPVLSYLVHGLPIQTFTSATAAHTLQSGSLLLLSGYTHQHDVVDLHATLGYILIPVDHGPLLPGTDEPSFVVYRVVGVTAMSRATPQKDT